MSTKENLLIIFVKLGGCGEQELPTFTKKGERHGKELYCTETTCFSICSIAEV